MGQSKNVAMWVGSKKKVIMQLIIGIWAYITYPFVKYEDNNAREYFERIYQGEPDPFLFDGKNSKYYTQLDNVIEWGMEKSYHVIDLGCGNGSLYYWFKEKKKENIDYLGVDFAHDFKVLSINAKIIKDDLRSYAFNSVNNG